MHWKVMIVDDDRNYRFAMQKAIPWEKNGFVVSAEAVNGRQALEILKRTRIHLVLTDMDMPVMDGVELTRQIKTLYPDIIVIALSAYDDFQYVKESMRLGAEDYILKQEFDGDRIIETIKGICEAYSDRWTKEMSQVEERKQMLQYLKGESINEISLSAAIAENQRLSVFLARSKDEFHKGESKEEAILFMDKTDEDTWAFVSQFPFVSSLQDEQRFQNSILRYIRSFLDDVQCIGVCDQTGTAGQLPDMYRKARKALEIHFFFPEKKEIHYLDVRKFEQTRQYNYIYEKPEDETSIGPGYFENKLAWLENELKQKMPSLPSVDKSFMNLYRDWAETVGRNEKADYLGTYEGLKKCRTLGEKTELIRKQIQQTGPCTANSVSHPLIQKVIRYINEHYAEDLSVGTIAEYSGYNENYFSNLFRQEMNDSFVNYVNSVRIEKAKQLLDDPRWKVYEIAEKVGYRNASYFSTMFKKQTGLSVSEYKNRKKT